MWCLEIVKWPPSDNHAYTVSRGRKILSQEGRAYKTMIHFLVAQQLPPVFSRETAYAVKYELYRPDWLNKGWPKEAKTRYKHIDVDGALKLLQDAVAEALGIDDCQFFERKEKKCQGPMKIVMELSTLIRQ